jgi:hypothetical protein
MKLGTEISKFGQGQTVEQKTFETAMYLVDDSCAVAGSCVVGTGDHSTARDADPAMSLEFSDLGSSTRHLIIEYNNSQQEGEGSDDIGSAVEVEPTRTAVHQPTPTQADRSTPTESDKQPSSQATTAGTNEELKIEASTDSEGGSGAPRREDFSATTMDDRALDEGDEYEMDYAWDFGVAGTEDDASNEKNPGSGSDAGQRIYPENGTGESNRINRISGLLRIAAGRQANMDSLCKFTKLMQRSSVVTRFSIATIVVITLLSAGSVTTASAQEDGEAVSPAIEIQVHATGNATWIVTNTVPLGSEAAKVAFENLSSNRTEKQSMRRNTVATYQSVARQAGSQLNRTMAVDTSSIALRREGDTGVITIQFRWVAFARTTNGQLRVGDVFTGGFPIEDDRKLTITGPEAYRLTRHNVTAENATVADTTVSWDGPATVRSSVDLTYEKITPTPTTTSTSTPTTTQVTTDTESATTRPGPGLGVLSAVVGVLFALLAVRHAHRR